MKFLYLDFDLLKPQRSSLIRDVCISDLDRHLVRKDGFSNPVFAYPNPKVGEHEHYLIFAGFKTWLLAQESEFQTQKLPVIIQNKPEKVANLNLALINSLQQEQALDVIEEGFLIRSVLNENPLLNIAKLARQMGRKRSDVSNQLRLLKLPIEIRNWIKQGKLSSGAGRALITLPNKNNQISFAKDVMLNNLSVRELEKRIREIVSPIKTKKKETATSEFNSKQMEYSSDANIRQIEQTLSQFLGSSVRLVNGKVVIDYHNDLEILQGILEQLGLVEQDDPF